MLFSSVSFLYYFLPVVLVLYFLVPFRWKNLILFVSSVFFYFYGEPLYSILMVAASLSGYLHGLWIHRWKDSKYKKIPLISALIIGFSGLFFFKYTDFFISNINALLGSHIGLLRLALPIGISFYTFQIMSYVIDLYRGNTEVQRSFLKFATYVCLFPQLIAGPIVRYTTVAAELTERKHSFEDAAYGILRFLIGLSKKVLIANVLSEIGAKFAATSDPSVLYYWLNAVAFTLQIYFDFSGYSDMAIGLGRIFGFHFDENFDYPFIAKSITDFWRRWHKSLSSWFRDYIYIPLGGNRVSKPKWLRNILVVWILTGFWHGADWNFIIWGLLFGVLLILEKLFFGKWLERAPAILRHIYVLAIVLVTFTIFNSNGLSGVATNLTGMFGLQSLPLVSAESLYVLRSYAVILLVAAFGSTPILKRAVLAIKSRANGLRVMNILEPAVLVLFLCLTTAFLIDGSFNPFLYFRF